MTVWKMQRGRGEERQSKGLQIQRTRGGKEPGMLKEPEPSRCGWRTVHEGGKTWGEVEEFSRGQNHDCGENSKVYSETYTHRRKVRCIRFATGKVAHFPPKHKAHSHPSSTAFKQAPGVREEEPWTCEQAEALTHTQFSKVKKKVQKCEQNLQSTWKQSPPHTQNLWNLLYLNCFVPA